MEKGTSETHGTKSGGEAKDIHAGTPPNQLLVAMIIDKSGSMRRLTKDTVDGFNVYLGERKVETPEALMSVTLFDDKLDQLHTAKPVNEIQELTKERYCGGGMGRTALNDAIGGTIAAIDAGDHAKGRRVLVAVMTDGLENASKKWTSRAAIADLVKRKESSGWKFVFFGANIDAFAEGESMSIPRNRSVQYEASARGTADNYRKMSVATTLFARGADEQTWVAELSKKVQE